MIEDYYEREFRRRVSVTESGCWLWTGVLNNKGYGVGYFGRRRSKLAHRFSYELKFGPIKIGLFCLHKCDMPNCVNPDHLFIGDQLANVADMWAKGRASPPPRNDGEKRKISKLTNAKVREYREQFAAGKSLTSLAREANVDKATMRKALRGELWRDAGGPTTAKIEDAYKIYRGERHANSKLTEAIVQEARARHAAGETGKALAKIYGVTHSVMCDALAFRSWKHVT